MDWQLKRKQNSIILQDCGKNCDSEFVVLSWGRGAPRNSLSESIRGIMRGGAP